MLPFANIKNKKPFISSIDTQNIFSIKGFENYINTNTFVLDKNFFIKNQKHQYYWDNNHWDVFGKSIPSQALKVMLQEETCVITNARKINKEIFNIVKILQNISTMQTDCHIFYCSENIENKGLGRHCDNNDNFIIQIDGTTNLTIWGEEVIKKTLLPNDVCYIPRLIDHCLESKSKRLSLSFPMAHETNIKYEEDYINL